MSEYRHFIAATVDIRSGTVDVYDFKSQKTRDCFVNLIRSKCSDTYHIVMGDMNERIEDSVLEDTIRNLDDSIKYFTECSRVALHPEKPYYRRIMKA